VQDHGSQKHSKSTNVSSRRNEQFSARSLYMSIYRCPSMRRYWRVETCASAVDGTMRHNQQDQVSEDSISMTTLSQMWPIMDTWHNITKIPMDEKLCVEEQVIPFKSTHSLTVYIRNKSKTQATNPFSCVILCKLYTIQN